MINVCPFPSKVIFLISLMLFFSCGKFSKQSIETIIIKKSDVTETQIIENIDGKGLEGYETRELKPEVFFESKAKIRCAILINDGKLYFGNENSEFYAVDIATKQMLWKYSTDEPVQTWPVFTDGKIIFNSGNNLYILDSENGYEIHKITYPSEYSFRVSQEAFAFNDSYTAVSDGIAYFAALNGDIVAVDIKKGKIIWSFAAKNSGAVASGVNYYDGKLYYCDFAGYLCCIDVKTRRMLFQNQLEERVFAPMYISEGMIYLAGRKCIMFCIDAERGKEIWSSYSYDTTTWFSGGSVSIGNTLFACTSDEHSVVAFDKYSGKFIRLYPTQLNAYTKPVVHGENIVVAAVNVYSFQSSYIMEFDTRNHVELWQITLDDCVLSAPAIYKDVLYFGADSGKIYNLVLNGD